MAEEKVEKPHLRFDAPGEVVKDPSLTKDEKTEALQSMEQDAIQMSIASGEGMDGGEPSNLDKVREAKESLDAHPTAYAYDVVLRDLREHVDNGPEDVRPLIEKAIEAIEAVRHANKSSQSPNSDAEIATETELEKLDP